MSKNPGCFLVNFIGDARVNFRLVL